MTNYTQFHDGHFEGFWIDGATVHLFLATERQERFVLTATGVRALTFTGVREGNILFEVSTRKTQEIGVDDIQALYDLRTDLAGRTQRDKLFRNAQLDCLSILEFNPSYGASGMILASAFSLVARDKWLTKR